MELTADAPGETGFALPTGRIAAVAAKVSKPKTSKTFMPAGRTVANSDSEREPDCIAD